MILLLASQALALDHHVVRRGETLDRIARKEEVDPTALRVINHLAPGQEPEPGSVLLLPGDDHEASAGVALTVSGTATAALPGEAATPLVAAEHLPPGTLVCTEAGSFATLRLATATETGTHDEITLLERTCLTLDASWSDAEEHASLVSVKSGGVSVRASDESRGVSVRTGAGVATGGAGGFRVRVDDGGARAESLEGAVSVSSGGEEVQVPRGFGSRLRKGQAPSAPVELAGPGAPVSPADGAVLRRPSFAWTPVERALGYRLEISTTPDFTDVVYAEDVGPPPWQPDTLLLPLRPGGLWWRVSSFDRAGFLGAPSSPARIALPRGATP